MEALNHRREELLKSIRIDIEEPIEIPEISFDDDDEIDPEALLAAADELEDEEEKALERVKLLESKIETLEKKKRSILRARSLKEEDIFFGETGGVRISKNNTQETNESDSEKRTDSTDGFSNSTPVGAVDGDGTQTPGEPDNEPSEVSEDDPNGYNGFLEDEPPDGRQHGGNDEGDMDSDNDMWADDGTGEVSNMDPTTIATPEEPEPPAYEPDLTPEPDDSIIVDVPTVTEPEPEVQSNTGTGEIIFSNETEWSAPNETTLTYGTQSISRDIRTLKLQQQQLNSTVEDLRKQHKKLRSRALEITGQ